MKQSVFVGYTDHIGSSPEPESVRRVFDGVWGRMYDRTMKMRWYSKLISPTWQGSSMEVMGKMFDLMDETAASARDGRTMDVPCGGAPVLVGASGSAPRGRYVGVDLSPGQLRRAARMVTKKRLWSSAELHRADACALPFEDGSFDLVGSFNGLHLIADCVAALSEFRRCLRPGGQLVGSTLVISNKRAPRFLHPWFFCLDMVPPTTADQFAESLDAAGFVDVGMRQDGPIIVFRARTPD